MKQKEVKEGHEKAIGNQLLRALKLDGKFLATATTTANPICFIHSGAKTWGLRLRRHFIITGRLKSNRSWRWASLSQVDLAHRLESRTVRIK